MKHDAIMKLNGKKTPFNTVVFAIFFSREGLRQEKNPSNMKSTNDAHKVSNTVAKSKNPEPSKSGS